MMPVFSDPALDLTMGTMIGEYEVDRVLGKGGFGSVYRAVHPLIGKQVAIKVLKLRYSVDASIVSRFIAEARAVNQIRHHHIIDIFSFGKLPDGRQYYVMELLDGTTLDRFAKGKLSIAKAVQILRPIALALDAAHAAGIAHRDLKPENIFIAQDAEGNPFPKLLDFGLAKLLGPDHQGEVAHSTESGMMMGTPHFMSPEQCRGRNVDHRTDFYALGAMSYQLITGRLPFTGVDHMEIVFKQMSDQPRPPSQLVQCSRDVDEAILAMLAKDPAKRPATAVEAINALGASIGLPRLPTPATGPVEKVDLDELADVADVAHATKQLRKGGDVMSTLAADARTVNPEPAPLKTASLPMGEVTPSQHQPARSHRWLVVGAIVVLVGAGLAVWRLGGGRAEPVAAAHPPADAAVAMAMAIDAVAPPPPPPSPPDAAIVTMVSFQIKGVPPGTQVLDAEGVLIATVPGEVRVPRGDTLLKLHLVHDGYLPKALPPIRPTADLPALDVRLQPRIVTPPPVDPNDLGEHKRGGR